MSKMQSYGSLLPRVLPQVLPCPKSMALDAIQTIAMEFCKETGIWQETISQVLAACDRSFEPDLPRDCVIANVRSLEIDGVKTDIAGYDSREIRLERCPGRECLAVITMSLRPMRTALSMPFDLLEEYGDYLVFGVLAKLKAMSGQKIEWTDPQGAAMNYELYQQGLGIAKSRKFKKRFGGKILYLNTGDI